MPTTTHTIYGYRLSSSPLLTFGASDWDWWRLSDPLRFSGLAVSTSPISYTGDGLLPQVNNPTTTYSHTTGNISVTFGGAPTATGGVYTLFGSSWREYSTTITVTTPDWLIISDVSNGTIITFPGDIYGIHISWHAVSGGTTLYIPFFGGVSGYPHEVMTGAHPNSWTVATLNIAGTGYTAPDFHGTASVSVAGTAPVHSYNWRIAKSGATVAVGATQTWEYSGVGNPFDIEVTEDGNYTWQLRTFHTDGAHISNVNHSGSFTALTARQMAILIDRTKALYTVNPESSNAVVYKVRGAKSGKQTLDTFNGYDTPALALRNDGSLFLLIRNTSSNNFEQKVSRTGARSGSWSSTGSNPFSGSNYKFSAYAIGSHNVRYAAAVTASVVEFKRSTDGSTWSSVVNAVTGLSAAEWFGLAILRDGSLLLANGYFSIARRSKDGGRTWSSHSAAATPFSNTTTYKHHWWSYDRRSGAVVAVGVSASAVHASRSVNMGSSWSSAVTVLSGLSAAEPFGVAIQNLAPVASGRILAPNGNISSQAKSEDGARTFASY